MLERAVNLEEGIWRIREIKGVITKILSFEHYVFGEDGKTYLCRLRGKQRLKGEVYVGDRVEFSLSGKYGNVEKILPRKNALIRPYVSNVDVALIVIAGLPEPDFLMVDKLIATCMKNDVEPVIVINKDDSNSSDFVDLVEREYGEYFKILKVSAKEGKGIDKITEYMDNKTVCLCGQSAVGKTTLVNALTGGERETGGMSKINRGRNTTRHIESYRVGNGFLVDTCGFSLLELEGVDERELANLYPEFDEYRGECKFNTCTHVSEPVCGVKKGVSENKIPKGRYERYIIIFNELKQKGGRY
ncbi:MAG: ribosome small subunit-dependent GTPase A [Clostridia bacterium]|nr:ribosome small subunit-dependent GTPase A [Clostridia bacterium]